MTINTFYCIIENLIMILIKILLEYIYSIKNSLYSKIKKLFVSRILDVALLRASS